MTNDTLNITQCIIHTTHDITVYTLRLYIILQTTLYKIHAAIHTLHCAIHTTQCNTNYIIQHIYYNL